MRIAAPGEGGRRAVIAFQTLVLLSYPRYPREMPVWPDIATCELSYCSKNLNWIAFQGPRNEPANIAFEILAGWAAERPDKGLI